MGSCVRCKSREFRGTIFCIFEQNAGKSRVLRNNGRATQSKSLSMSGVLDNEGHWDNGSVKTSCVFLENELIAQHVRVQVCARGTLKQMFVKTKLTEHQVLGVSRAEMDRSLFF